MSNEVIPNPQSTAMVDFSAMDVGVSYNDLEAGMGGQSVATLSLKGSRFSIRYKGADILQQNADNTPMQSLEVVLLKASPAISKFYYEKQYVEGQINVPDCFSLDGIRPDASSAKPQDQLCARCPQNQFGSRTTQQGKKAKACSDNRRVALVPAGDLTNAMYDGPLLLRLPLRSMQALVDYGRLLHRNLGDVNYNHVVTRLAFNTGSAFPLLTFTAVRMLADHEKALIVPFFQRQADGAPTAIERVLGDMSELTTAKPDTSGDSGASLDVAAFEAATAAAAAPQPVQQPAPQPQPQPVQQPVQPAAQPAQVMEFPGTPVQVQPPAAPPTPAPLTAADLSKLTQQPAAQAPAQAAAPAAAAPQPVQPAAPQAQPQAPQAQPGAPLVVTTPDGVRTAMDELFKNLPKPS